MACDKLELVDIAVQHGIAMAEAEEAEQVAARAEERALQAKELIDAQECERAAEEAFQVRREADEQSRTRRRAESDAIVAELSTILQDGGLLTVEEMKALKFKPLQKLLGSKGLPVKELRMVLIPTLSGLNRCLIITTRSY